jgi:hypothetical protein
MACEFSLDWTGRITDEATEHKIMCAAVHQRTIVQDMVLGPLKATLSA